MQKLIHELRRREVFRTAGLYVGICWITIEASSVLLPTFEAPEWILRALIIAAVIGFPIMLVLAWVYDINEKGISVQADPTDTVVAPLFTRKTDFVVIGVLSVALIFSVYLNFTQTGAPAEEPDPVSILIADFDNQTGNPLFDGSLEQALSIGIEGATFINAYSRGNALKQAQDLELGQQLDEDTARLVAVRQDVRVVLAGSIVPDGSSFDLALKAVDANSGELVADVDATAKDGASVLMAMNEMTVDLRKALGETTEMLEAPGAVETVTASSLQAIKDYTTAQDLSIAGQNEEAIEFYAKAVAEDPDFARAYSGWALSARRIGRSEEAEEKWQQALALLDRMTERERYRTLGLYYSMVSLNFGNAIDNYQQLVEKFPADGAGNNNLAVLYTMTAQYDRALAQSEQLLKIYPNLTFYHANHAHYAMYAGEFETLRSEANLVLEQNPEYFKAYMFLGIADLVDGDAESARSRYARMAEVSEPARSLSAIGLADIALYEGDGAAAIEILQAGLAEDRAADNQRGLSAKLVALAQAQLLTDDVASAMGTLEQVEGSREDGHLVPMSEIYAEQGEYDKAFAVAEGFRQQFRPTARAYADLIDGINAYHQGEYVPAIDSLQSALQHADLWIVRFYLAKAFLDAGYPAEATAEFDACINRRGEAGNLFFDDVPTWRYTAGLTELREQASKALSGQSVAVAR